MLRSSHLTVVDSFRELWTTLQAMVVHCHHTEDPVAILVSLIITLVLRYSRLHTCKKRALRSSHLLLIVSILVLLLLVLRSDQAKSCQQVLRPRFGNSLNWETRP